MNTPSQIKQLIIFAFLFLFNSAVLAETPDSIAGTKKVTAEELIELATTIDDLTIIDARIPEDRTDGHIEGSVALADVDTNEGSLAGVLASKDAPVLFYCNGAKCGRSVKSAKMAVSLGYSNIYWFRGGWEEWTEKGLPIAE